MFDNVDCFVEFVVCEVSEEVVGIEGWIVLWFLLMEELIVVFFLVFFLGMEIVEYYVFCIICNVDFEVEEDCDEDLL